MVVSPQDRGRTLHEQLQFTTDAVAGGQPSRGAVAELAHLVDAADVADSEPVLVSTLELAQQLMFRCEGPDCALVDYYTANIWSLLRRIRRTSANKLSWEQPGLFEQIYWLRSSIQRVGYVDLPQAQRAQIHCNLGNALSEIGRLVDALEHWRIALSLQRNLGMARGNLGQGLLSYAALLYDVGHRVLLIQCARKELATAVAGGVGRDGATYPEALTYFESALAQAESWLRERNLSLEPDFSTELPEYRDGEQAYRSWAIGKRLFLNPLNDVTETSIADRDVILLPSHRADEAGITYLAFFNSLKQEYAYARWCLFQGSSSDGLQYADCGVALTMNGDCATYSMAAEHLKTAFRCSYSLFDKIAYFVNAYWSIGLPERAVNFRRLWFDADDGKAKSSPKVRERFEASKNWPLRGLFSLSRDLYAPDLQVVAQPDAKELADIRNHLEHKHLKLVEMHVSGDGLYADHLAHNVEREQFEKMTFRIVQLARSALVYLSLAMHIEERRQARDGDRYFPIETTLIPDELKW